MCDLLCDSFVHWLELNKALADGLGWKSKVVRVSLLHWVYVYVYAFMCLLYDLNIQKIYRLI